MTGDIEASGAAQSKPESWQEIAEGAALELCVGESVTRTARIGINVAIILAAIERSHAAQPHRIEAEIRQAVASFVPANENIEERGTMDALNVLFRRIAHGHWPSEQPQRPQPSDQPPRHIWDQLVVTAKEQQRVEKAEAQEKRSDQPPAKATDDKQGLSGKTVHDLAQELAAERQRREQAERDYDCSNLRQQLISALAAIEKAKKLMAEVRQWHSDKDSPDYNECDTSPCQWCEWSLQVKADLSALREHDAEVRKPLVDLLSRANECLKHTEYANTIVPEIDDALAKVKP